MRIILKGQKGLVTQSDNTRVAKPIIQEKVRYKLKPNEFYFIDKKTGKKIIGRQKQEVISSDNRTINQRKQDQSRAKQIQKKQEADKNYEKGLETISTLSTLAMPSTYVGPVFNNNGKSYLDNVISGEGTGNTAGNLAIDLVIPFGLKLTNKGFQTGNKYLRRQTYKDTNNYSLISKNIYKDESNTIDLYKTFLAKQKIYGKTLSSDGTLITSSDVQTGFPEHIKQYFNQNSVERAIRTMREEGYSEREIQQYVDKINEELNKVKIGIYSNDDYKAASTDFGGFYNNDENFISVNKDAYKDNPKFTTDYILKHEGRHLIDYNTSMTDKTHNILNKAYDNDFLEIPKHEDAGGLKDYKYMDREKVTTNTDARNTFFKNKNITWVQDKNKYTEHAKSKKLSKDMVDFQNLLLKYAQPEDIIEAVETSNGYGKKYIEYLRKNNKLTPEKIEQFREAMIKVPSYMLPIMGITTYGFTNN